MAYGAVWSGQVRSVVVMLMLMLMLMLSAHGAVTSCEMRLDCASLVRTKTTAARYRTAQRSTAQHSTAQRVICPEARALPSPSQRTDSSSSTRPRRAGHTPQPANVQLRPSRLRQQQQQQQQQQK